MPRFHSPIDDALLFYRDYKPDRPTQQPVLLFIHGWPYSSLMYEQLLLPLCQEHNLRCIAPDRRGFGNSDWDGADSSEITYQTMADDTAYLVELLKIGPFVAIASSMGPGETVLAYLSSPYFRDNCKGFIWLGPSLPHPLNSPNAAPEVWDSILNGFSISRGDFTHSALPDALVGENPSLLTPETLQRYEYIVGQADPLAIQHCVRIIIGIDFSEKLLQIRESDVPILCLHGTKDIGMPYEASTKVIKELVPRVEVKLYKDGAHGLQVSHRDQVLRDILEFLTKIVV